MNRIGIFYNISIFTSANNSKILPCYDKCISLGDINSIILNIYKNVKLCFTIYNNATLKSCLIDLEAHPINKSK